MTDKLLHKMTLFLLSFILLIPMVEVHAQEDEVTVNVSTLKVRSGPGLTYETIGAVNKNEQLVVIGKENDWIQVKYGNTTGWVASWYTSSESTQMENQQIVSKVNNLNVRTEPSTSSSVIGQLQKGDKLPAFTTEGEWIEISFQGNKAWVNQAYVTITEQQSKEATTVPSTSSESVFVVSVDVLNVREKADLSSKNIGQVSKGQKFAILSTDYNWVQVELENGKRGWLYSFYGNITDGSTSAGSTDMEGSITILYNGTNLRSDSKTSSEVVQRVDAGESFTVLDKVNDWYKISLGGNSSAYVASWVVSSATETTSSVETPVQKEQSPARKKGTLEGLTIVIDAGHGGNDRGTTGALGTDEKDITLITAELLSSKLQAAGAHILMTRESDEYVNLRKRISVGHQAGADAFISLHYDAVENSSVSGFTTYYMHSYQQNFASYVHKELGDMVSIRDRGAQHGNYLVLRENKQVAILIELGYLSNPNEERSITTAKFREQATHGIYNGIIDYFDDQLN